MESFINKRLHHLSLVDRKKAFVMLCVVGLTSYCDEHEEPLDIVSLTKHCDAIFRTSLINKVPIEATHAYGSDGENVKPINGKMMKKSIYHGNTNSTTKNINSRKYRPDSVHNYPFVDTSGHVGDVFQADELNPELEENLLANTSYPGRMRLISKVYHEICSSGGKMGMKYVDIPVALKALGIHVSSRIEHMLTLGKGLDSSVKYREGSINTSTISLNLFQEIVKKCMSISAERQNSEQAKLKSNASASDRDDADSLSYADELEDDGMVQDILRGGAVKDEHEYLKQNRNETKKYKEPQGSRKLKVKHTNASLQRLRLHEQQPSPYHMATQVTQTKSKSKGCSNPASMQYRKAMLHDKQYYQQKQKLENDAIKKTVGAYKVQQYLTRTSKSPIWNSGDVHGEMGGISSDDTSNDGLDAMEDRGTHFDWRLAAANNDGNVGKNEKQSLRYKKHSCYRPDEDIVGAIADSFLNGPIARDILSTKEPRNTSTMNINHLDEYLQQTSDVESDVEVIHDSTDPIKGYRNTNYVLRSEMRNQNYPKLSLHKAKDAKIKTVHERTEEQQAEMELNDLLYGDIKRQNVGINPGGSKWKNTKGGWVADFGPLHTHSLLPFPGDSENHAKHTSKPNQSKMTTMDDKVEDDAVYKSLVPHREYAEIAQTYRETGVKPWKQHAILKKHYKNATKDTEINVQSSIASNENRTPKGFEMSGTIDCANQGSSFFSNSSSSSGSTAPINMEIIRSDHYDFDAPDAQFDKNSENSEKSDGSDDYSTLDINRNCEKNDLKSISKQSSIKVEDDFQESSSSNSELSSAPSEFNLDDIKLPAHLN